MRKKLIIASLIILIVLSAAIALRVYIKDNNKTINTNKVFYIVPKGASLEKTGEELEGKKVIKNKRFFIYYAKFMGYKGETSTANLIIKPQITLKELLEKLISGKSDFAIVTIPEGYSINQIGERLEKYNLSSKDSFVNMKMEDIDKEALITTGEKVFYQLEGFLFPDTYYIPLDFSEKEAASLMLNQFKNIFNEVYREKARELGLSLNQIITIASLIEREAANDAERSRISGVIYNRLKRGMLLQIDAAVIYANTAGKGHLDRVLNSHLKFNSKYNTYMYKGLPPGPIASPGKPSIEAALYPEEHDYLYYVASGESGHVFSRTYEEHVANVKKYLK